MVPLPETTARRRCRELVGQDSSSSPFFRPKLHPAPIVTYAKKKTTGLLSLTASQFRPDVYDISPDDGEQADARPHQVTARQQIQQDSGTALEVTSDTSSLSSARQLDGGKCTNGTRSKGRTAKGKIAAARSASGIANGLGGPTTKETRTVLSKRPNRPTKNNRKPSNVKRTPPLRRLPVNELVLVKSPLEPAYDARQEDSSSDIQVRDPVHDLTSLPRKRSSSSSSAARNIETRRPKASLSTLEARFKPSKYRHKTLRPTANGNAVRSAFGMVHLDLRGRDGFEDSELAIKPPTAKTEQARRNRSPLVHQLRALDLKTGPLPDVEFEPSTTELKLQAWSNQGKELIDAAQSELSGHDEELQFAPTTPPRRLPEVDRLREDRIRAQLSSISAPERPPSESDDNDAEGDEEFDDENEDSEEQRGLNDSDSLSQDDHMTESSSTHIVEPNSAANAPHSPVPRPADRSKSRNHGVSLDYRPTSVPWQLPRQSLGRRSLVEVNDALIEVPESDRPQERKDYEVQHTSHTGNRNKIRGYRGEYPSQ